MPHVPYLLLHLLSFVILVSLGVYSFRFRKVPVAFYFGIAMMLTALLVLAFTLEISSASLAEKVFWRKMFFIPVALEAVAFLVMAIYYLGQTHWLSRRRIAALMVVPAITILLTLTSDYHSLLRYNYHIDTSGPFPVLLWSNGPWFWVHIIFTYSMFVLTLALLFRFTRKDHPRYYRQTLIVMTGFLIPLITDMLFVIWKITPIPGYNPSVVVSAISGLMVAYGIFHYRIMDIVPVARSKVMDMIGDPLLVLDDQNRVLDFNRAMQTIPGFAEPLAIGQPADSVLGGLLNRYLTNSSARDKIWLGEEDHQMIFDLSISPIEDDHGNCLGRLFLFHDICEIEQARDVANQNAAQLSEANLELQKEIVERQAAEDALGRSEERLRLTLDAVNDGVWDWNIPADDVIFSPRWYTMLGYEPYEFPPSYASWRRLVHPDDIDLLERTIREHIAGAEGYAIEARMRTRSGDWCWILTRGKVIERDTDGRPIRMVGTQTDITERKRSEVAVAKSEEKHRLVVENANEAILVAQDGFVKFANPAASRIEGRTLDDLMARPFYEFVHPDDRAVVADRHHRRLAGDEVEDIYTFRVLTADGNVRIVEINAVRIEWQGQPAILNFLSDITERRLAEDALKASLKEKEVLLKEIHHRVKNNLQIIFSMLNLQGRRTHDEGARRALADCQNRVKSMALVHESLYRSEDLGRVNFADYIKSLTEFLFSSFESDTSRVSLKLALDKVSLEIDQAIPCGLIINELVTNCLKHAFPDGRRGEIEIELQSLNGMIVLDIRDNGIGLQADSIRSQDIGSLGLKLVKSLVKQLKGTVDTDLSSGTEFRITFAVD